jgi:hypothetical protein
MASVHSSHQGMTQRNREQAHAYKGVLAREHFIQQVVHRCEGAL